MNGKLAYKMLLVFLLTTACSVVLVVVSNQYFYIWKHDKRVIAKFDEKLFLFADAIAAEYSKYQGWSFLDEAPVNWELLTQSSTESDSSGFIAVNPNIRIRMIADNVITEDPEQLVPPSHTVSLFNAEKELISGTLGEFDKLRKVQINYKGEPVGWLGVSYDEAFPRVDEVLIKKLSVAFNTIAGIFFLVSMVVVFLFTSKQLIAPIRELSGAMNALTARKFKTRIFTKRKDELGILAQKFNTMAQQLQEYDRNQKQWLSDISHELRTPLSTLTSRIDAMQDGILKPDKATLSRLGHEAAFLKKIVEDLQFISLAESGETPMEKKPIKPLPLLTQVICSFESRLKENNLAIDVNLESEAADLEVAGDRIRLQQVFSNIIENSIRYTDKPGLLVIRQNRSSSRLKIIFEDSGPGVPDDALPRLFERLYRTEPSRSRKTGGCGLGLAICKTIIASHNGNITSSRSEKGGLKIEISLPFLTAHDA